MKKFTLLFMVFTFIAIAMHGQVTLPYEQSFNYELSSAYASLPDEDTAVYVANYYFGTNTTNQTIDSNSFMIDSMVFHGETGVKYGLKFRTPPNNLDEFPIELQPKLVGGWTFNTPGDGKSLGNWATIEAAGPCTITFICGAGGAVKVTGRTFAVSVDNGATIAASAMSPAIHHGVKGQYYYSKAGPVTITLFPPSSDIIDPALVGSIRLYYLLIESGNTIGIKDIKVLDDVWFNGQLLYNNNGLELEIYNSTGVKLLTSKEDLIDLSSLINGVYIVRAMGTASSMKIIK